MRLKNLYTRVAALATAAVMVAALAPAALAEEPVVTGNPSNAATSENATPEDEDPEENGGEVKTFSLDTTVNNAPANVSLREGDDDTKSSTVEIADAEQLADAIKNQADNQTWNIAEGNYTLTSEMMAQYANIEINGETGFVFPIIANNLTIVGNGDVTITSDYDPGDPQGGAWHNQNFVTVGGDGVTIENVTLQGNPNSYYGGMCNKVLELAGNGKNLTLNNVTAKALEDEDGKVSSGSIYINVADAGTTTLQDVTLSSWINCRAVTTGEVVADGVVQDFTKNQYAGAGYAEQGFTIGISSNTDGVVKTNDCTIKVDGSVDLVNQVTNNVRENTTIELTEDVAVDEMVYIKTPNVTIEGNGNTITSSENFKAGTHGQINLFKIEAEGVKLDNVTLKTTEKSQHALDIWGSQNVVLNDVKLDNTNTAAGGGAPLIVNGSDVTMTGNVELITGADSWYAADVDSKNGDAKLTVADGATVTFSGENPLGVKVENSSTDTNSPNTNTSVVDFGENVTVNADNANFVLMQVPSASQGLVTVDSLDDVNLPENVNLGIVAEVDGKTYSSLTEALNAGGTVKLLQDVQLDSMLNITKDNVTLDLNQHAITAAQNFTGTGNNSHLVNVMADGVTITNGTLRTTASNKHALNIYDSQNVKVTDLVMDHTNATTGDPLTVAGSDVTLGGKIVFITGDKSWYAANVDSREIGGQNVGASLYVADGTIISFAGVQGTGIKVEDSYPVSRPVSLTFGKNVTVTSPMDDFKYVTVYGDAKVYDAANAGLKLDADGAYIKEVKAEEPVESEPSHSHNYTWQYNADKHWQYCADCGSIIDEGTHNYQWKQDENGVGYQQCLNCGYRKPSEQTAAAANSNAQQSQSAASSTATAAATTSSTTAAATSAIPQTSDESNPMLWVVLLLISGGAFASMAVYSKKKKTF